MRRDETLNAACASIPYNSPRPLFTTHPVFYHRVRHHQPSKGIKGVAAYTHHADMLGARDSAQYAAIQDALVFLASPAALDVGAVLEQLLALGGVNLKTMEMLSNAHAGRWASVRVAGWGPGTVACLVIGVMALHRCSRPTSPPNPTLPKQRPLPPRFGVPTPTEVPLTVRPGPCILITGHDMSDLELLLKATEGKGVNGARRIGWLVGWLVGVRWGGLSS